MWVRVLLPEQSSLYLVKLIDIIQILLYNITIKLMRGSVEWHVSLISWQTGAGAGDRNLGLWLKKAK